MTTWNMFSDEVTKERHSVRNYGIKQINNCIAVRSYKAQALRELSMRLELQALVETMQREQNKLIDRTEELELELEKVAK